MESTDSKKKFLKEHIKSYPDFPTKGIIFKDIFSLLVEPKLFLLLKELLLNEVSNIQKPDVIVGIDSRGFLLGPLIALELKIPFVPVRKKGKLPGATRSITYALEYGEDSLEVQVDAIKSGQNVLICDDLLATGGTIAAACKLIKDEGANVAACLVVMEITDLKGRSKIESRVNSIVQI